MTSYQARVLRWMMVLAVLIFAKISSADQSLNSFTLEKLSNAKMITAEQAINNLRRIIQNNIDQDHQALDLKDEAVASSQRDAVIALMRSGENFTHLCDVGVDYSYNSGDDACLEKLNELTDKGQLMSTMNMPTGRFKHFNKHPMATFDQVKALYPFYTQDNKEGLILYLAVSSGGLRRVGVLDLARDFGLLSREENGTISHFGAIYLIKLGKKK